MIICNTILGPLPVFLRCYDLSDGSAEEYTRTILLLLTSRCRNRTFNTLFI